MLRLAQEFHFFMVHKLLHYQPLYRWFHATHHKSYNPGPWSGLSMHPVTLTRVHELSEICAATQISTQI